MNTTGNPAERLARVESIVDKLGERMDSLATSVTSEDEGPIADSMARISTLDAMMAIVSAYVSNNPLPASDVPGFIASVYAAVSGIAAPPVEAQPLKKEPAVNPKKSVTPDAIICLEDGMAFKSLKRHISTHYGLTPDQYREKWGLPRDYPMVAPNYAAQRSKLAKEMGLGRKSAAN